MNLPALLITAMLLGLSAISCRVFTPPPQVTHGEARLRIVRFPEQFMIKLAENRYELPQTEEFRFSRQGGESLLFRMKGYRAEGTGADPKTGAYVVNYEYSDNAYAVSLDGRFDVRAVLETEWEQGQKRRETDDRGGDFEPDGSIRIYASEGLEESAYKGRRLAKTGAEFYSNVALVSPNGKWVAVFSHTSRRRWFKRPSLIPFMGGDDRIASGTMFVDLFDARTGERLATAQAPHEGSFDMYVFTQAAWIEDRYFVMPLDTFMRGAIIGIMPEG